MGICASLGEGRKWEVPEGHPPGREQVVEGWDIGSSCVWHPPLSETTVVIVSQSVSPTSYPVSHIKAVRTPLIDQSLTDVII